MRAPVQVQYGRTSAHNAGVGDLGFADALTMRAQNGRAAYLLALAASWCDRLPAGTNPDDWRLVARRTARALRSSQ